MARRSGQDPNRYNKWHQERIQRLSEEKSLLEVILDIKKAMSAELTEELRNSLNRYINLRCEARGEVPEGLALALNRVRGLPRFQERMRAIRERIQVEMGEEELEAMALSQLLGIEEGNGIRGGEAVEGEERERREPGQDNGEERPPA